MATLVWSDDFTGTAGSPPNPAYWNLETGGNWDGGVDLQQYTGRTVNVHQDGGSNLLITARAEQYTGADGITREYTSARVDTSGLFSLATGYIEWRAKIPATNGAWPALWTVGTTGVYPANGELDVFEQYGDANPFTAGQHIHYTSVDKNNPSPVTPADAGGTFHTYGVYFDTTQAVFYVDNTQTWIAYASGAWPFGTVPQYPIIDLAVTSNAGNPATGTWPQTMTIDWVRAYTNLTPADVPALKQSGRVIDSAATGEPRGTESTATGSPRGSEANVSGGPRG